MRRAAKIDATQREIVDALRAIGCSVLSLASIGKGCPDLLVSGPNWSALVECKSDGGKLNETQQKWHDNWRGPVWVVWSAAEALRYARDMRGYMSEARE